MATNQPLCPPTHSPTNQPDPVMLPTAVGSLNYATTPVECCSDVRTYFLLCMTFELSQCVPVFRLDPVCTNVCVRERARVCGACVHVCMHVSLCNSVCVCPHVCKLGVHPGVRMFCILMLSVCDYVCECVRLCIWVCLVHIYTHVCVCLPE